MFSFLKKLISGEKNTGKNEQLDTLVSRIQVNASNNYKDAAQQNFRDFEKIFTELSAEGKLSERQTAYYQEILEQFRVQMKNFTHKDQKPTWTKD